MEVKVRQLQGRFNMGFALDKHSKFSRPIGENEQGHMQFETIRTEAGEAVYQLKYRNDHSQATALAEAVAEHIVPLLPVFDLIVPMPASNQRAVQPVNLVSNALGTRLNKSVFNLLNKASGGARLKDLNSREEKDQALVNAITLDPLIGNEGRWNVLLVDDLFHSGASVDASCDVLRTYEKIGQIYVATLTWR